MKIGRSKGPYGMQSPVLTAQPLIDRVLSYFFGVLITTILCFAAWAEYTRVEPARGEVTAASGFSAIVAEQSGVISEVLVQPGDTVAKGQPLARLSRPQTIGERGDTIAFSIAQAQESLRNISLRVRETDGAISATREQISRLRQSAVVSTAAASARRSLTYQRKRFATQRAEQLEELRKEGIVTSMAVDQARGQSMQLLQEAADADLTINEIGRARDERTAALDARIRELIAVKLSLETERLLTEKQLADLGAQQGLTIVAPSAGVVAAISVRAGQRIEPGHRAFAVARPSADLTVVLQVPSKAIGLIEAGQRVSLKYDAFPFQTFGLRYGRVARVENVSLESGQVAPQEGKESDRKFLVEVTPEEDFLVAYGRRRNLKVGMMLTADIQIERRTLLAWWLSPLTTLTGRMS